MAPLSTKERLDVLAAHYRETFSHQREYLSRRDRLFAYSLVAAVALAFRAAHSTMSDRVLALAIEHALGAGVQIDAGFLAVVLWFVFFALTARYFQATITVERQYKYIERVEEEMSEQFGSDVLSREGASYAAEYPKFSAWMHAVYMWAFPAAVVAASLWSAYEEFERRPRAGGTWIALGIAVSTVVTVGVYVYSAHFENEGTPATNQADADVAQ